MIRWPEWRGFTLSAAVGVVVLIARVSGDAKSQEAPSQTPSGMFFGASADGIAWLLFIDQARRWGSLDIPPRVHESSFPPPLVRYSTMTWYPQSPRVKARLTGAFWLVVFVAGTLSLSFRGGVLFSALTLVGTLCYLVVTLLLYDLLKPVNRTVALLAALFGIVGCVISLFHLTPVIHVRDLVFFGLQCVLVGYLIYRSTFLPRILGALLVLAGLGWLTFVSPSLVTALSPYNLIPGMIGEGLLLLWLLVKGVDVERWNERAVKSSDSP